MARPTALTPEALHAALATLPGWSVDNGKLCRAFTFPDFSAAFAFMTRVALAAEALNHHPDWSNSYNRVEVALLTHDQSALTALDVELAQRISAAAVGLATV